MGNIDAATRAYATAVGSAGSATRENERYMSSLEARLTALKAEFQNLSTKTIQSEFVGSILDAGTAVLKFAQSDIGQAITKIGALSASFVLLNRSTGGFLADVAVGFKNLGAYIYSAEQPLKNFGSAFVSSFGTGGAVVVGLTLATTLLIGLAKAIDNGTHKQEQLTEAAEQSKSKYQEIKSELDSLSVRTDLTEEEEKRLKLLQAQADLLKKQSDIDTRAAFEGEFRGTTQVVGKSENNGYGYGRGYSAKLVSNTQIISEEIDGYIRLQREIESTKSQIDNLDASEESNKQTLIDLNSALDNQELQLSEAKVAMLGYIEKMNEYVQAGGTLTTEEQELYFEIQRTLNALDATSTATEKATNTVLEYGEAIDDLGEEEYSVAEATKQWYESLLDANGKLDEHTQKVLDADDALKEMAKAQADAALEAAKADYQNAIIQLENLKNSALDARDALYEAAAALSLDPSDIKSRFGNAAYGYTEQDEIAALQAMINERTASLKSAYETAKSNADALSTNRTYGGGGGSSSQKTKTDELKEELKLIDAQVELSANRNEQESNRVELYKVAQEKIKTLEDYYRKQGYSETSAEIVELENLWYDYADKIAEIAGGAASQIAGDIEDATEDIEAQIEAERKKQEEELQTAITNRQDEINAFYDAEISKLEQRNKEVEKAIDLEEKLEALEKAKSQRMLVYEDGQFKYQQNYAAIAEAQKPIDEANLAQIYEDEVARLEAKRQEELALAAEEEKIRQRLKALSGDSRIVRDEDYAKALVYLNAQGREYATDDFGDVSYGEGANKMLDLMNYAQGESYSGSFMGVEIGKVYNDMIDALGKNTATVGEVKDYISTMVTQDYINKVGSTPIKDTRSADSVRNNDDEIRRLSAQLRDLESRRGYASGTTSATFGLHMLGEKGRELGILSHGDGVVPHNITENLMKIGQYSPIELIKSIVGMVKGFVSSIVNQNFGNITLPNVTDFNSFANEMKNFKNYATQNAYNR